MGQKVRLTLDQRRKNKTFDVDGFQSWSSSASIGEKRFRLVKFNQHTPGNVITQAKHLYHYHYQDHHNKITDNI